MPQEKVKDAPENQDSLLVAQPYVGKQRQEAMEPDPEPKDGEGDEPKEEEIPDEELGAEDKSYKKRYGDLRRHNQEKTAALQEQIDSLTNDLKTATPNWTPPKTDEEIDAFAEDNPEAYDILVSVAAKQVANSNEDVVKLRKELKETKQQSEQEKARVVLLKLHPDWDEIRDDDDFHAWADDQPSKIQDGIYKNATDGALAARMIDLYKQDMGISGKKATDVNDLKKAAATLVNAKSSKADKTSPKKTFTRADIGAMTIQEYEANEKDILAAQRDGRIE